PRVAERGPRALLPQHGSVIDLPCTADERAAPSIEGRLPGRCGAPQPALVADAQRDAVAVEPLEQQLGLPPRAAEQVAEAGERDRPGAPAFLDEQGAGPLVLVARDDAAVAEAYLVGRRRRGAAARQVEPRADPHEAEERQHVGRPRHVA